VIGFKGIHRDDRAAAGLRSRHDTAPGIGGIDGQHPALETSGHLLAQRDIEPLSSGAGWQPFDALASFCQRYDADEHSVLNTRVPVCLFKPSQNPGIGRGFATRRRPWRFTGRSCADCPSTRRLDAGTAQGRLREQLGHRVRNTRESRPKFPRGPRSAPATDALDLFVEIALAS
jgi:hypothetical protein